jgi:peptidoglycan hydrolase CwlO-like protein
MEKSIEIYNTIIEDLKGEIESLLKKVDELEKKIDNLKKENDELKDMLARHDARLKDNNKN